VCREKWTLSGWLCRLRGPQATRHYCCTCVIAAQIRTGRTTHTHHTTLRSHPLTLVHPASFAVTLSPSYTYDSFTTLSSLVSLLEVPCLSLFNTSHIHSSSFFLVSFFRDPPRIDGCYSGTIACSNEPGSHFFVSIFITNTFFFRFLYYYGHRDHHAHFNYSSSTSP
jgi:hypothetical protein